MNVPLRPIQGQVRPKEDTLRIIKVSGDPLVPKEVPLKPSLKEGPLRLTEGHQARAPQTERRLSQVDKDTPRSTQNLKSNVAL